MSRPAGWYWVQVSSLISDKWEAAKHSDGRWFMADRHGPLPDGVIHTVGPRIPDPDEQGDMVSMPRALYELLYAGRKAEIDRTWSSGQVSAPSPGKEE